MYLTKSKNRLYISGASFNIGLRVLKIIEANEKTCLTKATGKQTNQVTNLICVKGLLQNRVTRYKKNLLDNKRR